MNMSNICVIGAGRMGSLYGALLAKNGLQVTLYDPWRQHIDTIRQNGLRIDGISGDLTIRIPATAEIEEIAPCDIALVLSDTNGTAHAAEVARRVLIPSGFALTLQNGIGNVEILSNAIGANRVLAGLSYHSAALAGPGYITHTHAGPTYLGEITGESTERLSNLVRIFENSNFNSISVDNITAHIWEKWVHNCAINAISAISGLRVGEISNTPAADELQSHVIAEALAVVKANGISLPEKNPAAAIKAFCKVKFNKPSMLQHMEEGRPTEVDALNGAVVSAGQKLGIDTPYNHATTLMVKAREQYMRNVSGKTPIDYDALELQAKKTATHESAF
jgi:2-dehydropantoate 2-reductase